MFVNRMKSFWNHREKPPKESETHRESDADSRIRPRVQLSSVSFTTFKKKSKTSLIFKSTSRTIKGENTANETRKRNVSVCRFIPPDLSSIFVDIKAVKTSYKPTAVSQYKKEKLLVWWNVRLNVLCRLQNKYKESGRKSQTVSVYSQLADTNDIQFAKTVSEIQSEVRQTVTRWI